MNTRITLGKLPWKGKIQLQGNGMDAISKSQQNRVVIPQQVDLDQEPTIYFEN